MTDKFQTTEAMVMSAFLDRPEVRSTLDGIAAACQREREIKAVWGEFSGAPHAMAAEIWKLRRIANGN